ncbi:hypothetical protein AB1Y20_005937 [Prymnesium parvum]|uniref:Uncharacterized protein n=1 Tax=Prymnesium parvum TaxID=97485 RepID=A0AB34J4B6_PRYPA
MLLCPILLSHAFSARLRLDSPSLHPHHTASAVRCLAEPDDASLASLDDDWRRTRARLVQLEEGDAAAAAYPAVTDDDLWAHSLHGLVERGCLLVAKPDLECADASLWRRSIILVLEHGEHGTVGIALNRPTQNVLGEIVDNADVNPVFDSIPLYFGGTNSGPVAGQTSRIWALARSRDASAASRESSSNRTTSAEAMRVLPGLYLESMHEVAKVVSTGHENVDKYHYFVGCTEWAPGELEQQVADGTWLTAACSVPSIFSTLEGEESPDEKHQNVLSWFEDDELGDAQYEGRSVDDHKDGYMPLEIGYDDDFGAGGGDMIIEHIVDLSHNEGGLLDSDGTARGGGSTVGGKKTLLSLASAVVDSVSMWVRLCDKPEGPTFRGVAKSLHRLLTATAVDSNGDLDAMFVDEDDNAWARQIEPEVEAIAREVEVMLGMDANVEYLDEMERPPSAGGVAHAMDGVEVGREAAAYSIGAFLKQHAEDAAREQQAAEGAPSTRRRRQAGERKLVQRLLDSEAPRGGRRARPSLTQGESAHAESPRFTLHLLRTILRYDGGVSVREGGRRDEPSEEPAAAALAIGLQSPLRWLARNVRTARHHRTRASWQQAGGGARKRPEVQMDSSTFGVVMSLVADRLGLPSRLVEADGAGLLLQVQMEENEEPLYVILHGSGCGKVLLEQDIRQRQQDKANDDVVPAKEMRLVPPLEMGSRLARSWSQRYKAAGDSKRSSFWEVQRLVLERLQMRLDKTEETRVGMVVRVHRDKDEFGI